MLQICFFKHEHIGHSAERAERALGNPRWSTATTLSAGSCTSSLLSMRSAFLPASWTSLETRGGDTALPPDKRKPSAGPSKHRPRACPGCCSESENTCRNALSPGEAEKTEHKMGRGNNVWAEQACRGHCARLPKCQSCSPYACTICGIIYLFSFL